VKGKDGANGVGIRCKTRGKAGRGNSSNEMRQGEILRMKMDKSEEGPDLQSN